jgi:TATA-box binding protein (TBP) (component of TFIID and TFIIIB)
MVNEGCIPLAHNFYKKIVINENEDEFKNNIEYFEKDKIEKFRRYIDDELLLSNIPKDIYISTMTVTCKIENFKFNCENIARYIDLSYDDIGDIICAYEEKRKHKDGEKKIVFRSLPPKNESKSKSKKKKKKTDVFYNQVSIHLNIKTKKSDTVHVKLFRNGSLHLTGCQTANDVVETIATIIRKLSGIKYTIDKQTKKIVENPYVSDKKLLDISHISGLKVNMINTNFIVPLQINLDELFALLTKSGIECRYDKMSHSCVNVKYNHPEKQISIFVFEKGSIVITGAKNGEHISLAYNFINKFLYSNYRKIVKKDIGLNLLKFK